MPDGLRAAAKAAGLKFESGDARVMPTVLVAGERLHYQIHGERASALPPLLLVHGTSDQIAFARGSQEFSKLAPGDCTLKLWEGLYHETHNEPEKALVLNNILEWMESKL